MAGLVRMVLSLWSLRWAAGVMALLAGFWGGVIWFAGGPGWMVATVSLLAGLGTGLLLVLLELNRQTSEAALEMEAELIHSPRRPE